MLFFFPETRFNRTIYEASSVHAADESEKSMSSPTIEQVQSTNSSNSLVGTKNTWREELSLWSGTTKQSYFSHFLRPFFLVAYPAVAWGILACK